jgi:dTDP-4-dehydrorhamnose reductase
MKVLVLGASGMIGHAMFRVLHQMASWDVWGTLRSDFDRQYFPAALAGRLVVGGDVERPEALPRMLAGVRPDVVINCVGLTKHHQQSEDPQLALPVNALLPHRLADLCAANGARLIHVSTDCVFAGSRGDYRESDPPDAMDVYGKSKHLGEVDYPHAVTLRTSTIGHELHSANGLLEWFLAQEAECKGYACATFSGLTNREFARVVRDFVIPNTALRGLYHVGGMAINKFDLLGLIADTYSKSIHIHRDDTFVMDRSLNTQRFCEVTGYMPPAWVDMIREMHSKKGFGHV